MLHSGGVYDELALYRFCCTAGSSVSRHCWTSCYATDQEGTGSDHAHAGVFALMTHISSLDFVSDKSDHIS